MRFDLAPTLLGAAAWDENPIVFGAVVGGIILASVFIFLAFVKRFLYLCGPDEALIFSGGKEKIKGGRGFRVVFAGWSIRKPIIERADRISLSLMEVGVTVTNAYSKGGVPLRVDAIANVKVSHKQSLIRNAIERFLGRNRDEIKRVAKETLEGHLRGVIAKLTPEEVNEDRLKFAGELSRETEEDLNKLGIHLDTLKIQHVADEVNYLDSIGREAIANVVRDAEIAESDAKRDAEQEEASNLGRAKVTTANVEARIAQMKNELRRIKADLESEVKSQEERTAAAAREARAKAEQELQTIRASVEHLRLAGDTVLPAEADKVSREFRARGDAALYREKGRAVGEVIEAWNQAWRDAGEDALSIHLIQEIEKILSTVAQGVKKIQIKNLSMIDSGDGRTLSNYVGAYPEMLKSIFNAVADTTGIDVPGIISGKSGGSAGADTPKPPPVARPQTKPSPTPPANR